MEALKAEYKKLKKAGGDKAAIKAAKAAYKNYTAPAVVEVAAPVVEEVKVTGVEALQAEYKKLKKR